MGEYDEETRILICGSVDDERKNYIVPGTLQGKCADCGRAIYISPASQRLPDAIAVCIPCGLAKVAGGPNPKVEAVPGQEEEISAYFQRN